MKCAARPSPPFRTALKACLSLLCNDWCLFLSSNRWALEPVEASKCQSSLLHPLMSLICVLRTHTQTHRRTKSKLPEGGSKTQNCKARTDPKLYRFILRFFCLPASWFLPSWSYLGLSHTFRAGKATPVLTLCICVCVCMCMCIYLYI